MQSSPYSQNYNNMLIKSFKLDQLNEIPSMKFPDARMVISESEEEIEECYPESKDFIQQQRNKEGARLAY